ncbi:hypothetical protein ACHQM5_019904 [Ranunculus cassubicifolius]
MTNTIYFHNIDRDNASSTSTSSRSDFDNTEILPTQEDIDNLQLEVLKEKIKVWNISMPIALKSIKEQSFYFVAVNTLEKLLSFGDAFATSKRSPDKLFMVLDMYNTMCQLEQELQTILAGEAYHEIRELALTLKKKLADIAHSTLDDFDQAVENDATEIDVLDGGVHPMTRYVINFLNLLLQYESTVKHLLEDFGMNDGTEYRMTLVTFRILQALQTALGRKSGNYSDEALYHLFLMNNVHHIVTFGRSKAKDLLGDEWVQIHQGLVQRHAYQYIRISLRKVLQAISVNGLHRPDSGILNIQVLKDRFKKFNMLFEDLYQRNSQWTVPDSELRESLRISLSVMLLPGYRSFLGRYSSEIKSEFISKGIVRYTVDDLDRMLGEFFGEKERIDRNRHCF